MNARDGIEAVREFEDGVIGTSCTSEVCAGERGAQYTVVTEDDPDNISVGLWLSGTIVVCGTELVDRSDVDPCGGRFFGGRPRFLGNCCIPVEIPENAKKCVLLLCTTVEGRGVVPGVSVGVIEGDAVDSV